MRNYEVTITGETPLLMQSDNIDWADKMSAWATDADNKKISKAGDDRTPAWRWVGYVYDDGKLVGIPSDNIMKCLAEGSAMISTGKGPKTFKAQSQSGMMIRESHWPITTSAGQVPVSQIHDLMKSNDFEAHKAAAIRLGFELFVKRAKVGTSKHIRVRPRFGTWAVGGTICVWDDSISTKVLTDMLKFGGLYKGLGDWRPGGKTPGQFGMFKATVKEIQ